MAKGDFEVFTEETAEKAVLVGIDRGDLSWPLQESLAELERLAHTAGAEVVGVLSQKLTSPNPRTFIGQGKAEELVSMVNNVGADVVILDDELTPSQQSNLERLVGKPVKVIDRTALILDIFALHATSREGRLQVKLAQNQYLYPRLRGMWSHLAAHRMGGGVGSRFGEGESQLEVDRRLVRKRISSIRKELKEVATNRATQRKGRNESGVFRIALAGYTNAGKSSLLNRLTDADVLAYDKLFATLDSTTRQLELPDGCKVTITDTVGFIQKLPHSLVEAFHSTLDEICEADLVLLVVDVASKQRDAQAAAVREVLGQIEAAQIPVMLVYNKIDLMSPDAVVPEEEASVYSEAPHSIEEAQIRVTELSHLRELHPNAIFVSAQTGEGIDGLRQALSEFVAEGNPRIDILIPYDKGKFVQIAHELGVVETESYETQGTRITMRVPKAHLSKFESFLLA